MKFTVARGDDQRRASAASRTIRPEALSCLLKELAATPGAGDTWDRRLHPGDVVGRFELVRELGAGGFGVVYEARDRELGRSVAFKAVRPGDSGMGGEQLLREAEAIARLSHPNLVTLHDAGRCEQGPYLVLELLRGITLKDRLAQGPLPAAEALRIGVEVARGLAHAHGQGVIHRDLKPSNVFLCEHGVVKVLDFGMAHAFGLGHVTGGTAAYMAPEQERGAPEDERTDVFALGVILYKMLSGELPFPEGGKSGSWRQAAQVQVPDLPALGPLVARMLEKDPVKRPRHAGEVLAALSTFHQELERTPSTGQTARIRKRGRIQARLAALVVAGALLGAGIAFLALRRPERRPDPRAAPCVAVLPFATFSDAKDDAFFAEAIHGELITQLAKISGLRVIARSSVQPYQGPRRDLKAIAAALGAGTILEGTVQRAGGRVRIAAQLVDPANGHEMWADRFDRDLSDVFAIQTSVALEIARVLGAKLTALERRLVERPPTANREAHDLFLRGVYYWERSMGIESDNQMAEEMLAKAVERDAGFALAHAWLAIVQSEGGTTCAGSRQHADRALHLEPDLPQAHAALGSYLYSCEKDVRAAIREYEIAVRDAPGDAVSRAMLGGLRTTVGQLDEGLAELQAALALDPRSYYVSVELARELTLVRRFDEAERACQRAQQVSPGDVHALATCALIPFWREGDLSPASRAVEVLPRELPTAGVGAWSLLQLLALFPEKTLELLASGRIQDPFSSSAPFIPRAFVTGSAHAALAHADLAREAFAAALGPLAARVKTAPDDPYQLLLLGRAHAGVGRPEDALREARRALELWRGEEREGLALRLLAEIAAAAGRNEEALDALRRVLARRDGLLTLASLRMDPRFAPLRRDPRFAALADGSR